ncbi:ribosomal protein S5 domain 2-like superfamily protein [Artemisia annua]|uniref:Ribosomal protein S5 domain 2-like superfamily protein n=1 Tax=Artemisia annua TaxID=35608 RepID=A0A2U1PHA5_ARTAN|nr:ribosomal protein S5 domain 2-like superfamily protein [Artemisia annua]
MQVSYNTNHSRISSSLFHLRSMVTATATTSRTNTVASVSGGAFTTVSERVTIERDIKKSKFIAIAGHIPDERSAQSFLSEVQDPRATHNCWAYKVGNQYRSNDDGEPSGTAGKPIHSAIENSGLDRVMVVVIRHFGGIKLGTGGLVRAYGGVATECLKSAPTRLIKSQVPMGVEVSFDLLGVVYHQLQSFKAEDIKQDYDTGKDGITMVTFKISFDQAEALEEALKTNCSRNLVFYKH